MDQATDGLLAPETVAENCWFCPLVSDAGEGITATGTVAEAGISVSEAVPTLPGLATLVAMTTTFVLAVTVDGAV
jgi:hypothetical protein